MVAICCEKDNFTEAGRGHFGHDGIGSVQYGVAGRCHVLNHYPFEHSQVFHSGDVVEPQVVATAYVSHYRNITTVKPQTFPQNSPACNFKHGSIHIRVHQNASSAFRSAAIAAVGLPVINVNAIRIRHANAQAMRGKKMGNQPRGGGLAIGSRDSHHWNSAVVDFLASCRK